MKTSRPRASSASSNNNPIGASLAALQRGGGDSRSAGRLQHRTAAARPHRPAPAPPRAEAPALPPHQRQPLGGGGLRSAARLAGRPQRRTLAGAAEELRPRAAGLGHAVRRGAAHRARRRRGHAPVAGAAAAALPRGSPRRHGHGPAHRLLRAADRRQPRAPRRLPGAAARAAGRPGHAQALLDAPAAGHAARGAGRAARARDRLCGRPAGRAGAADPGLGPAAPAGQRRPHADGAAGLCRPQRPALCVGGPLAHQPGRAQGRRRQLAGHQGLGASATPSACRRCCGPTRASSSSARSRCPTRAWARAARWACR